MEIRIRVGKFNVEQYIPRIQKRMFIFAHLAGISLSDLFRLRDLGNFIRDRGAFERDMSRTEGKWLIESYPILGDRYASSGNASGHYFHQDLLVAQKIFLANPRKHVDIGSRVDGFIAHVASFREIEVFDIRPMEMSIPNVRFVKMDLMKDCSDYTDYCDSISSLHAIEHFGLGRYGDRIDVNGHIKGLDSIYRMLKKRGIFYFSVPIGRQRVEFNAHRVFSPRYLLDLLKERYEMLSFSYVDDAGTLHADTPLDKVVLERDFGCEYGCGIFELRKR
jgi:SAM-dependent methyltransferase